MTKIILFALLIIQSSLVGAQSTSGKIYGTITSADHKVLESATVSLLKAKDSSLVKIAIADKTGGYKFENLHYGNFLIQAEALGYQKKITKPVELTSAQSSVAAGEMKLDAASKVLAEVSVTGKRPLIENKIDKTVVNVDASPTNTGLTALEVLEKSPGVTVDNNGNISLKGKQGVVILIDDKPMYLSGEDLTNYLKNLSANQLDQIEIMSQPSAKYDARGNSGVINIKTKKNRNTGLNGNFSTSAIIAKYFKNTNSITANWRKDKVNLFANYGFSYWEGFNTLYIDRAARADRQSPFTRYSEQVTHGRYSGRPQNFKFGLDYFANKNTTLGFVITGNPEKNTFTSNSHANIFDSTHKFVQYNDAISQNKSPQSNVGFNINLQKKFDTTGSELSADADYILYRTKGKQYSYNYLYQANKVASEDPYLLEGYLPSNIDIFSFKSDYKHPFNKTTTLEAGIKTSYVKTDNDAQYNRYNTPEQKWLVDTSRSNHFIYKENINAAYINLQKQIKKVGIQLGLRAEQTIADGNQVTRNIAFHKNYIKLFPTTYISYKKNDNNTFGLSYGRRIERPNYQSLNPFQYQLDRYTYRQGNPNLQPQFSHNIELSYNYKGQLNLSANYTAVTDIINDVLITKREPGDSNYTTYLTTQNIASSKNIGLSASYNKQLKKWWTINAFANVYNNRYKGVIDNEKINVNFTSFSSNLSSQFNFKKGWTAEISGWYNSKNLESSAIVAYPMGMFSLGGGKQILKNKGTIRVNLRDPFYILSFKGYTDLNKSLTNIHAYWDNRRAIISFTYRFGKTTDQPQRKRGSAADEEKNRIGSSNQQ
ncbi:TonB-dependent receptor [Segetibacter koreensis]|uniref:TonB-dependent receptor n=1 Tax=Segetibacter koreensis TaxID=398037 RepID=UPI00039F644B|nr:TonB-dependent receptor [Segetibacter koreensis]